MWIADLNGRKTNGGGRIGRHAPFDRFGQFIGERSSLLTLWGLPIRSETYADNQSHAVSSFKRALGSAYDPAGLFFPPLWGCRSAGRGLHNLSYLDSYCIITQLDERVWGFAFPIDQ